MNRDHDGTRIRKQNGAWQPQQQSSPYLQNSQPRSISPQPPSPASPHMHINTKPGSVSSQQRSNPSSPAVGSAANAMEIAARHYEALQKYLLAHILKEKHGVSDQRIAAREKLSRLLQNQLQDLSTDVYDELNRRTDGSQALFLSVRDEFHPKRNQARQKLATLPQNRFKDLASDVYVQLERQFPSLLEMYPLKELEETEFLSQPPVYQSQHQDRQDRESTTPTVQQSNLVPNVATFTIQDSSNADEEETYYRSPAQQAPSTPSALDGNVNFASLDSLMADLGNIVSNDGSDSTGASSRATSNKFDLKSNQGRNDLIRLPSKGSEVTLNGLGINTGATSGDQTVEEYETRIQALRKRLQHLESEVGDGANRPDGSRLAQVERQLAKHMELYNEQLTKVTKLQLDYNKVLNDYHAQLETVDMVNQEVKALVMENLDMKQRHLDAEEELQLAYNRIKQLEDENGDLKVDIEDARRNLKRAQEDASSRGNAKDNTTNASAAAAAAAVITPTSANDVNINDKLDNRNDKLEAGLENDFKNMDWNNDRQQARDSIMVNTSSVVHQGSLDSLRNAVDDLLQAGRSDSSSAVLVSMKSVVIACKVVTEDVEDHEHDVIVDDRFADLKQELSSGLTQLMSAAKVHSNSFEEEEEEFERTLMDLEAAADQLEAIVMDIVNVPKGKISSNGGAMENGNVREKSTQDGGKLNGANGGNVAGDDQPMDVLDLKIYLETQTGLIVSTIQTLLTSLRSSSDPDDISDASDNITKVVDQVIRQTRITLATPGAIAVPQGAELQSQGEMVLEDLENSLDLLIEMKEQLEAKPEMAQSSSAEAKSVKQKMASASFDIAKYTKELVSLIED